MDRRDGRETNVAVCDRASHTIQFLNLDGQHLETHPCYGLPANLDTWKNLMLVSRKLHARVTLLNENNEVVARLGDDVESVVKGRKSQRNKPTAWNDGKFEFYPP